MNLIIDPEIFIKNTLNKSSVLNSINKVSSLIYISGENFYIYEFSWLSKAEIISGESINDLDMFDINKLSCSSDSFLYNSKILEKYAKERGTNKDYCIDRFKKSLNKYKTSKNFKIFYFNSFSEF